MEEKGSALYLCPNCGAFVSEDAGACPKCGTDLTGDPEEDTAPVPEPTPQDEAEVEIDLLEKEIASEEDSPAVTLFLCSVCGAFTSSDANICPNCGSPISDEGESVPSIQPGETESAVLEMLVLSDEPPVSEENILEDLKKLESEEDVESFLQSISDDIEGLDAVTHDSLMPERSDDSDEMLSRLVDETLGEVRDKDQERSEAVRSVKDILDSEPARSPVSDNDTIALCKSCGAFVSETAVVCNICGNSLMDSARLTAQSFLPEVDIEHTEDDADSVMRKMLGVSDDAALDPGAGKRFQSDGSLGLCTVCGAFISQEAESCPVCGTHMEDMPDFVPSMDIVEPEQEEHGLAICPHCGVFVQEGATECMSCVKPIPEGATVPISEDIGLPEDDDKAARTLKTFLGVEKALEIAPVRDRSFTGLDLCPDCGAFVSMDAVVCSICGAPLFEDAEDMMDIDKRIGEIDSMKCPNCSTKLPVDSDGCSSCGLSFFAKPKEEDISAILNIELEQAMAETEPMAESAPTMPDVAASSPFDDDILDLLVSEEEGDSGPVSELTDAGLWDEPGLEVPYPETPSEVPEPESAIEEIAADEPLAPIEPIGSESIEFIQADSEVVETVDVLTEETLVEEAVAPASKPMAIREIDIDRQATTHAANWTTGVYISLATICFFLFFYAISPGIYAPGLAVIFISLLLWGIYLVFAERSLFFKGDLKHATPFIIGIIIGVLVLFQQPLGLFESAGLSGQPGLDRILLSVSVLLTVIGLVWIRARVRFVFTWLFGNLLLFLSTVVSSADASYGTGLESPVLLVAGFGTALIVMSLVFLQYERAISSSIETDVVRGDAHYLKRDYVRALASYDSALSKAQMKKVEVLASPIVQYDVPWYSKGSALIFMGEFEEGIKCLDMALAINPCNEVSWVNKGNAHSKLGQHDLATECYTKAIECNPFYEIAWNNLGNVHARRKDYLNALKHYNRAIKINPKYDDAWINKGYVLAKMGKREQAVKCLNHVGSRVKGKTQTVERDVHLL